MIYNKYKIRVNYKSGNSEEFWTWRFSWDRNGNQATWAHCDDSQKPILLGVEEVESIWQVGYSRGILGEKKV